MPPRLALNSAFCFDQDERFLLPISPPAFLCCAVPQFKKAAWVERGLMHKLLVVKTTLLEFGLA